MPGGYPRMLGLQLTLLSFLAYSYILNLPGKNRRKEEWNAVGRKENISDCNRSFLSFKLSGGRDTSPDGPGDLELGN